MQHTLVAVFDNRNDAQQAMDELLASNFTSTNVRLSQADPTGSTDSITGASTQPASTNDDDSIASSIRNFFSDIFGTDDNAHAQRYSSAVTRGHHVLTVGPVSEPEVEREADIVERFGPIDIDEESSGYGAAIGGGADQIMRRDSPSLQGGQSQSLSLQNDDRLPFQQGNLNDAVPMGGTYQEPMGDNGNLGGQRMSSNTAGMSMQDDLQYGSMQRDTNAGSGTNAGAGSGGAGMAPTEIKRPGVRVFSRDPGDLGNSSMGSHNDSGASTGIGSLGTDTTRQQDNDTAFRSHWSATYGPDSGTYDEYAPAYSYGSSLASNDKYRGRSWDDAESDIRSDWDTRNSGGASTWEKMKAAVRQGWDRMTS